MVRLRDLPKLSLQYQLGHLKLSVSYLLISLTLGQLISEGRQDLDEVRNGNEPVTFAIKHPESLPGKKTRVCQLPTVVTHVEA